MRREIIRALRGAVVGAYVGGMALATYAVVFCLIVHWIEGSRIAWDEVVSVVSFTAQIGALLGAATGGSASLAREGYRRAAGVLRGVAGLPVALLSCLALLTPNNSNSSWEMCLALLTPWAGVPFVWSVWMVASWIAWYFRPGGSRTG